LTHGHLPPGPAGVLPGPGPTGMSLLLPGLAGTPSPSPRPLAPAVLAQGAPRLGPGALIRPGLAPGRCLHLLGQLLGAARRDKRPLAPDRDPHAFQGIKQNAPPGEPGPELACVVIRPGVIVWHGIPPLLRACPFSQHKPREPEPLGEQPDHLE